MNLLAPLSLLWLLPVGGAIVVLYLLRLKRRDVVVPSILLWQTALQDTQANAPFQKLKRNLLLLLQLVAAALLVFALSRPFLWASGLGGKSTALVLDASASMKATDVPGGRFAEAVRQAESMIGAKAPGDAVALVQASDRPALLCPLTTDREKLRAALKRARATDAAGDMREAIGFAGALVASRAGAQVTLVTDGAFGRLDEMQLGGPTLGFVIVGKRADNVAVTAFDVRDTLGGGAARQAFVGVQNFSNRARTVPLEVRVNGKLTAAHELALKPGEAKSEVFDALRADAGGLVEARLDVKDDLAADDAATITLAPRRALKLLLVSEGNPFLERALNIDERVTLDEVAPARYRPTDSTGHDVTLFDNAAPPKQLPAGRYLFWGPQSLGGGADVSPASATSGGEADRPQILDWSRTHPLMRFVDLANVKLLRARNVAPAPWASTLAESEGGPLVTAGERGDTRAVYVGFAVVESDMPLRPVFPIFVSNCLQWLSARPGDGGGATRPGEPMPFAAPPGIGPIAVTRPDGRTDTVTPATGSAAFYDKTDAIGVYRAKAGNWEQYFAVSLMSATESNTAPVARPSVAVTDAADEAKDRKAGRAAGTVARREVWPYLAAVALLVLTAEWWAFHRRV